MDEETYWKVKADADMDAWAEMECESCNGTNADHEEQYEEWECHDCGASYPDQHENNCDYMKDED